MWKLALTLVSRFFFLPSPPESAFHVMPLYVNSLADMSDDREHLVEAAEDVLEPTNSAEIRVPKCVAVIKCESAYPGIPFFFLGLTHRRCCQHSYILCLSARSQFCRAYLNMRAD